MYAGSLRAIGGARLSSLQAPGSLVKKNNPKTLDKNMETAMLGLYGV